MKKKSMILVIGIILSFTSIGNANTLKAFFSGYDEDMQLYTFEDENENYVDFSQVSSDVLKSFDLNTEQHIGASFLITFTVNGVGEKGSDNYYEELTITKMKSIALKKTVDEDEE